MPPEPSGGVVPDGVMARIGQAMELAQQGRRDDARTLFAGLWDELGPDGDPLHRVTVAHWMADVQDDPRDELTWDERALEAAGSVTDERATVCVISASCQKEDRENPDRHHRGSRRR